MSFTNTSDPDVLTISDVARWCVELSFTVRDNPDDPNIWLSETLTLYRKIEALAKLAKLEATDTGSVT